MEIPAEPAQQHKINGPGRARSERKPQRVHRVEADGKRRKLFLQRLRVLRRAGNDRHGVDLLRIGQQNAALLQIFSPPGRFQQLKREDKIGLTLVDNGRVDLLAIAHVGHDAAAALAHAVTSLTFTS